MKVARLLMFSACVAALAAGQVTEAPPAAKPVEKPKQDEAAMKLLERYDTLVYAPRAEGLKDIEFVAALPNHIEVIARWKAPDKVASDIRVAESAPPEMKQQLAMVLPMMKSQIAKSATGIVNAMIGDTLRDQHKDDEVTLAAPNQVKVVAKSPTSIATFKEQTITFADTGLPKEIRTTSPVGDTSMMEPTFREAGKKHVLASTKATVGTTVTTITFEHVEVGGFTLLKKMTTSMPEAAVQQALEFKDHKVNSGLDDKLFEKPAGRGAPDKEGE